MNCDACQIRLNELLDAGHEVSTDAEVQAHFADCAKCREYAFTLDQLDGCLADRAESAVLPTGFKRKLMAALPEPVPRLLPAEMAQRRRELEAEHQRALARLRRQFLIPSTAVVLRSSAVLGGFVFAGLLAENLFRIMAAGTLGTFGIDWALRSVVLGVSVAAGSVFLSRKTLVSVLGQILRTR